MQGTYKGVSTPSFKIYYSRALWTSYFLYHLATSFPKIFCLGSAVNYPVWDWWIRTIHRALLTQQIKSLSEYFQCWNIRLNRIIHKWKFFQWKLYICINTQIAVMTLNIIFSLKNIFKKFYFILVWFKAIYRRTHHEQRMNLKDTKWKRLT